MPLGTPDTAQQVEDRIKADVQREAPDSNPYLTVHWLRSLISGIARRIFDFYTDLRRTENRLFPNTTDSEAADTWGQIYVGARNPASASTGNLVATGSLGGTIPAATLLTSNGAEYTVLVGDTITNKAVSVVSLTRTGSTATATTDVDHNLSSFVPVTVTGANETEYNVVDASITVTGPNSFQYEVVGVPTTPATGSITSQYTTALVTVQSVDFGSQTNLSLDTPVALQSPIVNVDGTFYVTEGGVEGGTDTESTNDYVVRYLSKIRNPVANFNIAQIEEKAKEVAGVTRVFVERAGTIVDGLSIVSIENIGSGGVGVGLLTNSVEHNLEDSQFISVNGADQPEYNTTESRIIVVDDFSFIYLLPAVPAVSPATGTLNGQSGVPLGQVRTYFMRDNDLDPIPSPPEVAAVKAAIDVILPANTATGDNMVLAPTPVSVSFTFSSITPDTPTMRSAINANIAQFFAERTVVGVNVDEDAYRAAIINTVDPSTSQVLETFELTSPSGDIAVGSGEIAVFGATNL